MFALLGHVMRVAHATAREKDKDSTRSPHWPATRRAFLKTHPACEACGRTGNMQVHHVKPFHTDPTLELDPTNLIALCMALGGPECHLTLGHGSDYKHYAPTVRELAAAFHATKDSTKRRHLIELAQTTRLVNAPPAAPASPTPVKSAPTPNNPAVIDRGKCPRNPPCEAHNYYGPGCSIPGERIGNTD